MTHENSIIAYHDTHTERRVRKEAVLAIYQEWPQVRFADREIMIKLGFKDMNAVRPRITELVDAGVLIECGKIKDGLTKRTVRTTRLYRGEHQTELFT